MTANEPRDELGEPIGDARLKREMADLARKHLFIRGGAQGWRYWRMSNAADGSLAGLALTRPDARVRIDRRKVWTMVRGHRFFIANWIATQYFWRESGEPMWSYDDIDKGEAQGLAYDVPTTPKEDLSRILRPEAEFTFAQINKFTVETILGKVVAAGLKGVR
ncbi:hypothetical protein [Smaragdicoccus niigatensis]|uniref:hypothetical protein n=1 Tax=Smaragdicoccus niigatensis TaxID=359359 RepID=UPI00036DB9A7|nr:hypothetical protein [Smaragdicoccus niigatensis]